MVPKKNTNRLVLLLLFFLILCLTLYASVSGSMEMGIGQLLRGLFVRYDPQVAVIYDLRLPRILLSLIAGATLASSGVLLQAVMQNPLTDPGIIGISSAASFTSTAVLAFAPQLYLGAPLLSIMGGLLAYLLLYSLSWKEGSDPIRMILVGVALNMAFGGLKEVFSSMSGQKVSRVQTIIEGNIAQKTWQDVRLLLIYASIGLILSFFAIRSCNLLSLEDNTARSVGVNVDKNRFFVALIAIILASSTTAVVGLIGFIGLIVPHIARLIVGTDHRYLLPFSALLGSFFLLLSDTFGRLVAYPYEISAAVIMTVIGGPFFIFLLRMKGKEYEN